MNSWPSKKLAVLAEKIDYGHTASASESEIGPKFLRITDIQHGEVNWETVPYCECSGRDVTKYVVSPGDIVFARTGATTGKSFLIRNCPEQAVFASYLIRVRPLPLIDPVYLSWFFQTPQYWAQISRSSTGTAQAGVNASKLKDLELPLPPLPEQRRIAAILDKADTIRRKRLEAIRLTEEFLRSAFLEMFGDPVVNPKGWEVSKLEEISEIVSGVTKGRKLAGRETVMVPYMRVANVQDGHIDLSQIKDIEVPTDEVTKFRLRIGDVLLTEGGDPDKLGRGAVWYGGIDLCIHQNHIFRVRVDSSLVLPEYTSALIGSELGKKYFLRAAKQTTGIASINKTQLRAFPMLVPPIQLQKKWEDLVGCFRNTVKTLVRQERVTHSLLDSLVQRAFRGELNTSDPNDEPVEELKPTPSKAEANHLQTTFLDMDPGDQADAVYLALWLRGPYPWAMAVKAVAEDLRERSLADFKRFRKDGPLGHAIHKAMNLAAKYDYLDRPKRGHIRAIQPDPKLYSEEDWQNIASQALRGLEYESEEQGIRHCAEWARENCGLEFNRLRKDGVIWRGIAQAIGARLIK
jgi:type I restriction enzyme, S subunit